MVAALFADEGFEGAGRILTDPDGGIFSAYSDGGSPESVTAGLGSEWELSRDLAAAAAGLELRAGCRRVRAGAGRRAGRALAALSPVAAIRVPESAYAMCAGTGWSTELGALQSARYVCASLLAGHPWWTETFDAAHRGDPDVGAFAAGRVAVQADPAMALGGAAVTVELDDGRTLREQRSCAAGDPGSPLSREEIIGKLRRVPGSCRWPGAPTRSPRPWRRWRMRATAPGGCSARWRPRVRLVDKFRCSSIRSMQI